VNNAGFAIEPKQTLDIYLHSSPMSASHFAIVSNTTEAFSAFSKCAPGLQRFMQMRPEPLTAF